MSSKEQIMKTKNVRGGNMKGYTIVEYCEGKAVRGSDNWVTLSVLLGMTDFSEGEVDAIADLEVGEPPIMLDAGNDVDVIPEHGNYIQVTRVR